MLSVDASSYPSRCKPRLNLGHVCVAASVKMRGAAGLDFPVSIKFKLNQTIAVQIRWVTEDALKTSRSIYWWHKHLTEAILAKIHICS
jgi:hypothetical protein